MNVIHRIAEFGPFIVYRRGRWHQAERLPKYVVGREAQAGQNCMLEEFRRRASAIRWAQEMAKGEK